MAKRAIEIRCSAAAAAKLEELVPLQGDLKKLDADRGKLIRCSIMGFRSGSLSVEERQ